MVENQTHRWTKENIRSLRLRLGWSKSDLAHRLHCSSAEVESWEEQGCNLDFALSSELEILLRQAEACSHEVHYTPVAESRCDKDALEQIEFSRIEAELD